MAADLYKVFEGVLTTSDTAVQSSSTDYTPASGRLFVVRAVAFFNGNASAQLAYLKLGNMYVVTSSIQAASSQIIDVQNSITLSSEKIYVKGQIANDIRYRIWGIEMDM